MTVKKNDMASFKSGVYKNSDGICQTGENVNHGLLLVGYGEKLLQSDREPTKFWIIQNSLGERWGEQGFLNVERGTNLCNFATDAYFPVLKKTLNPIEKPSLCKETQDIFGSGKKYQKSFCLIDKEQSYKDSQKFCLKNGMRLLRLDSNEARETLLNYANKE
jgi:Papain family cysteine protease